MERKETALAEGVNRRLTIQAFSKEGDEGGRSYNQVS